VPYHDGKAYSEHVHTDGLQYNRGSCKYTTTNCRKLISGHPPACEWSSRGENTTP